jgi:phage terminase small subunit
VRPKGSPKTPGSGRKKGTTNQKAPKSAYSQLSDQQKLFVDAYVNPNGRRFNKTAAARAAGYSCPEAQGCRVYENAKVRAAIDELLDRMSMPKSELLARIDDQSRGVPDECLDDEGRVNIAKLKELGLTHLIKKVKITTRTLLGTVDVVGADGKTKTEPLTETKTEVELESTQSALTLGARARGALTDKVKVDANVTAKTGVIVVPERADSGESWAARAAKGPKG